MTQEELAAKIQSLDSSMRSMSEEWTEFLKIEARKRENDEKKAVEEVNKWEKEQTFLHKHGMKIAGVIFSFVTAGLAWYGAQIRSEIHAEQRSKNVESNIAANKRAFENFKEEEFVETQGDIQELQIDSVNQTIMIQKGFERIDKAMLKAHPRQFPDEESLPAVDPEFKEAADEARRKKMEIDKFGRIVSEEKKKP